MKSLPVYQIKDFRKFSSENAFYANYLKPHIRFHDFTNTPHKHDFFFLVLFTKGRGIHEIDFKKYTVKPGSLFFLKPGQMHNWKISPDGDGYIFFHTRDFYDQGFTSGHVQDYSFYASGHTSPLLQLKNSAYSHVRSLLNEITEEYHREELFKFQKLHALVNLVYVELTRLHKPSSNKARENYLDKLRKFEELIDAHFREFKAPSYYAGRMNISEKHLNRIVSTCLHKTSTVLIAERVALEAKRMLMHSAGSISQIGEALGYNDKSYFTRFFKKQTGETPLEFIEKYKTY